MVFQLLHKWKNFEWTEECVAAFEELKRYLSHPHVLLRPEKKEVLYAYITVTGHVVSLVLVRTENGVQKPVYYVSKSLQEAEARYLPLEKAALAIINAMRKLPHYFQAHTMEVLRSFDIKYLPRTVVKRQVLANFVAEFNEDVGGDKRLGPRVLVASASSTAIWEV